jgi:hypothetical protein
MNMQRRPLKKFTRKCAALYRWFTYYRKRVRMIESELGSQLEAC